MEKYTYQPLVYYASTVLPKYRLTRCLGGKHKITVYMFYLVFVAVRRGTSCAWRGYWDFSIVHCKFFGHNWIDDARISHNEI